MGTRYVGGRSVRQAFFIQHTLSKTGLESLPSIYLVLTGFQVRVSFSSSAPFSIYPFKSIHQTVQPFDII